MYRLVFTSLKWFCEHDTLLLKNPLYIISIFMKGKRTHNFLLYRYERGSKKAKLRETDATQRATVAFGCFGLCTSNFHTHREVQFLLDYTVFLAVNTRTMDPTPPAASAFSCHCNNTALLLSEGLSKPL